MQANTRRAFALTSASAGLAAVASRLDGQTTNPWQGINALNPIIVHELDSCATQAIQAYGAGKINAADVIVLGHSFGLWSQHVHQIGAEPIAAASLAHAFDAPLSATALEQLRQTVSAIAKGPRIESAFGILAQNNTPANMAAIKRALANGGVGPMHAEITAGLNRFGQHIAQSGAGMLPASTALPGGARLVEVQTACQWGAIAGLYMATWSFMGATGTAALAFLSGGTAFALIGLALGAYGVYCM